MDMIAAMSGALLILLAFAVGFFLGRGTHEGKVIQGTDFCLYSARSKM